MEGLTLVAPSAAVVGHKFSYTGATPDECAGCPFQKICFNLQPGHYRVVEVRSVKHPCKLHDEDKAQVVRVEPASFETTAVAKKLRGTAVTWEAIDCGFAECTNWKLCHPHMPSGKYAIEGDASKLDCPMDYDLRKITLR